MASVVTGGNYVVGLGTGYFPGSFYLDTQQGRLDVSFLDESFEEFVLVDSYVTNISITRGRKYPTDVFGTGMATITMRELKEDRALDPLNEDSPYYNVVTNQPGLAPLRKVRIARYDSALSATPQFLFQGFITSFGQQYEMDGLTQYSVQCADIMYTIAQTEIAEVAGIEETSSTRIINLLFANPGIEYIGDAVAVGASVATLKAGTIPAANTNAYINRINEAEQGRVFASAGYWAGTGNGLVIIQPRLQATFVAPSVIFNDLGTATPYDNLVVEFDQERVINNANVTIDGGTLQNASDQDSIDEYYLQTVSINDSLLSTDAQALALAQYLLDPLPQPRFTQVSVSFASCTDAQKLALADLEIGDVIEVTKTFTSGSPLTITQSLAIEGINHQINVSTGHRVTLYTSQIDIVYPFLLDDPVYGLLDIQDPQPALS
jgi:hypothetical protein